MLTVPYFKQQNEYFCGPASLQMAFAFFGQTVDQTQLAVQASTSAEKGTDNDMLVKVAQASGFTVEVKTPATLENIANYLKQNLPVIVNFIEPTDEEGHFAVVVNIDEQNITLNDPWNGANVKISTADFLNRWHSHTRKHIRWLMALTNLTPAPR